MEALDLEAIEFGELRVVARGAVGGCLATMRVGMDLGALYIAADGPPPGTRGKTNANAT
jgi:hypothetical protein